MPKRKLFRMRRIGLKQRKRQLNTLRNRQSGNAYKKLQLKKPLRKLKRKSRGKQQWRLIR
jgi:hypothetical protein